jgi:DNA-binding transcriptional ArsR family regulator
MSGEPDIATPARALGDNARGLMASALLGHRQISAGELARIAGVTASTASEHLQVLLSAGVVSVEHHGRGRFYRLANDDVARAVEALQVVAPRREIRSLTQATISTELCAGRTCYDHLAGDLGLRVADLLVVAELATGLNVGSILCAPQPFPDNVIIRTLGLLPPFGRRPWILGCLDWSGRRAHVAGQVGAQILSTMDETRWITRHHSTRAVVLTPRGADGLKSLMEEVS